MAPSTDADTPVLAVRDLVARFHTPRGVVHAVNGISYDLHAGEALGIVGESGCGKSVSALSLLRLVPPPGRVEGGQVLLRGRDVLRMSDRELRAVRGRDIGMVFQDPLTSLNPVLTVGYQIAETLRTHLGKTRVQARDEAVRLLAMVGIPNPGRRVDDHPHQLSGGQRQRVMIAMALACRPSVLIADEPTTALDVTVQAQIVALVRRLRSELGMAIVWITHDLALVAGIVDRIAVMYAGRIVEHGPATALFSNPRHPYTRGLLESMPSVRTGARAEPAVSQRLEAALPERSTDATAVSAQATDRRRHRLQAIPGRPPDLLEDFQRCAFADRCAHAVERCAAERPPLLDVGSEHSAACWRWDEL